MKLSFQTKKIEAGCDEAGRGCLAGPVVAGVVILPKDFKNSELNDSKQLTENKRIKLRKIIEKEAISWAVAMVHSAEIDEINILNASFVAMHRALESLKIKPEFIAVDGNRFIPFGEIEHSCCIKGDANYLNIAAASVLAKTYRDDFMKKLHNEIPIYNWKKNKGYPTVEHRNAIKKHGITRYHRKSFRLLPDLTLFD